MDEFAKRAPGDPARVEAAAGHGQPRVLGVVQTILTYYGYQSLGYLRELGGVILVVAAAFTLARFNHSNELTAMLASGVSLRRVLLPVLLCALALNAVLAVDSELIIPSVKEQLVRDRDDVEGTDAFQVRFLTDDNDNIWYASKLQPEQGRLLNPLVILRTAANAAEPYAYAGRIAAPAAVYDQAAGHWTFIPSSTSPAMLLRARAPGSAPTRGVAPEAADTLLRAASTTAFVPCGIGPAQIVADAGKADGRPIDASVLAINVGPQELYDRTWEVAIAGGRLPLRVVDGRLQPANLTKPIFIFRDAQRELARITANSAVYCDQADPPGWALYGGRLVVQSELTPRTVALRQSSDWMQYMSISELTQLLQIKRSYVNADKAMMICHTRLADFFNNILLLLVGVPFVLSRERNIKASALMAVLMVGGVYAFIFLARYVGLAPMPAAWLPLLVFGPISAVMIEAIKT
jgi:lipopolysaccharide export LptBFGC system permease protein LptF